MNVPPAPTETTIDPADTLRASRSSRRRAVLGVLTGVLLLLVVVAVWLVLQARSIQQDLIGARTSVEQVRDAVGGGGGVQEVARDVEAAAARTEAARATSSAMPWSVVSRVPLLGRPFEAVSQISVIADDLVDTVLVPAATAVQAVDLDALRSDDGRVDVDALAAAAPHVTRAADASRGLLGRTRDVPSAGYLPQVDEARDQLGAQLAELTDTLGVADRALTLLPPMLGRDGPRNYFVAFQTNAEARGTGGLVGAFGILTADRGRLGFTALGSNDELAAGSGPGVDLGPEFADRYDQFGSTHAWFNSNLTAHFPYAAQVWASLWEQQTGQRVDGAIATDPVALGHVLSAVGAVPLPSGEVVDADNVVALTESEVYARFAEDNDARKDFLQTVAGLVAGQALSADSASVPALVEQLARAADEGRLTVWSSRPEEQVVLVTTPLGGTVVQTTQPYAELVVNNAAGNKMDYYLDRELSYTAEGCGGPRGSTVTATLTNTAAADAPLTPYVGGVGGEVAADSAPGTNRSLVSLYATEGSGLVAATVDGVPARVQVDDELGHPVFTLQVDIPPATARTVVFELVEPSAPGPPLTPRQPLVLPMTVRTSVPEC